MMGRFDVRRDEKMMEDLMGILGGKLYSGFALDNDHFVC